MGVAWLEFDIHVERAILKTEAKVEENRRM